jgi:hypothetical protein
VRRKIFLSSLCVDGQQPDVSLAGLPIVDNTHAAALALVRDAPAQLAATTGKLHLAPIRFLARFAPHYWEVREAGRLKGRMSAAGIRWRRSKSIGRWYSML